MNREERDKIALNDKATAELLMKADISYGVRGQLNIDLRHVNEPKGDKSRQLQGLAASIANIGDIDPIDVRPSSEMLVIHNPGPSLRYIVESLSTDAKATGLAFDKSKGEPEMTALRIVDEIEDKKATAGVPTASSLSR